jgi:hypothetical protein
VETVFVFAFGVSEGVVGVNGVGLKLLGWVVVLIELINNQERVLSSQIKIESIFPTIRVLINQIGLVIVTVAAPAVAADAICTMGVSCC